MTKSFIQISDSHIDDNNLVMGVDSQANLNNIVGDILTKSYDALLVSGDLAHNGTLESYRKLKKILKPLGTNTYVLPGNHDHKQIYMKSLIKIICVVFRLMTGK